MLLWYLSGLRSDKELYETKKSYYELGIVISKQYLLPGMKQLV